MYGIIGDLRLRMEAERGGKGGERKSNLRKSYFATFKVDLYWNLIYRFRTFENGIHTLFP